MSFKEFILESSVNEDEGQYRKNLALKNAIVDFLFDKKLIKTEKPFKWQDTLDMPTTRIPNVLAPDPITLENAVLKVFIKFRSFGIDIRTVRDPNDRRVLGNSYFTYVLIGYGSDQTQIALQYNDVSKLGIDFSKVKISRNLV